MENTERVNYYLDMAEELSSRSKCLRKQYGAVIVKNNEIVSTGFAATPIGRKPCTEVGSCIRAQLNIPRGERYELCRSVHAEANAIIHACSQEMHESELFLVGKDLETGDYVQHANCCAMCKRMVINAEISKVYIRDTKTKYRVIEVSEWIENDDSLLGILGY